MCFSNFTSAILLLTSARSTSQPVSVNQKFLVAGSCISFLWSLASHSAQIQWYSSLSSLLSARCWMCSSRWLGHISWWSKSLSHSQQSWNRGPFGGIDNGIGQPCDFQSRDWLLDQLEPKWLWKYHVRVIGHHRHVSHVYSSVTKCGSLSLDVNVQFAYELGLLYVTLLCYDLL